MKPEAFGKYILLERLAAGGMGEVFLAKAGQKGFERFFAIKRILTQHADSKQFVEMLANEARISLTLVHPNITQVFEFGQIEGHFFLAMEYVEGLSVAALLRNGRRPEFRIPPSDAVWIAVQICRALHYAHTKRDSEGDDLRIVHRDISPQNILLDETGSVKLIDFGIAKAAQSSIQTDTSTIKGKIPYMAPEQALGEKIDPRADLYALGIVLYECLTYENMYPSRNTFETLAKVQTGQHPPIAERLAGVVPPGLIDVLEQALRVPRDERYQSAAAMERDLAKVLHQLEPGHTSQALAGILKRVDLERVERKERIKSYAKLKIEDLEAAQRAHDAALAQRGHGIELAQAAGGSVPLDYQEEAISIELSEPGLTKNLGPQDPPSSPRSPLGLLSIGLGAAAAAFLLGAVVWRFLLAPAPPPENVEPRADAAAIAPVIAEPVETPEPGAEGLRLELRSEPSGARVFVDGVLKGETPLELTDLVAQERHRVVLTRKGYADLEIPLNLRSAPTEPMVVRLDPTTKPRPSPRKPPAKKDQPPAKKSAGKGCAAVMVEPWAHVVVNGRRVGTTPLPCVKLKAGSHKLKLENPALGVSKEVNVSIRAGETTKIFERF